MPGYWRIGATVRIAARLQEQEPIWKGTMVLNDATPDNVKREGEWLNAFVDEKSTVPAEYSRSARGIRRPPSHPG